MPKAKHYLALQAFCADDAAAVQGAALANIGQLASSVGTAQRPAVLAAAADAVQRQRSTGATLWRGRLAFAEQVDGLAALSTPQAWLLPHVLASSLSHVTCSLVKPS